MNKYKIKLDDDTRKRLSIILNSSTTENFKKRKAQVILLKSQNKSINDIIMKTNLSKRTIINYTKQFVERKMDFVYYGDKHKHSELNNYKDKIKASFKENPALSYREAALRIEKMTGIKRSETQVRYFLNKNHIYSINSDKVKDDINAMQKSVSGNLSKRELIDEEIEKINNLLNKYNFSDTLQQEFKSLLMEQCPIGENEYYFLKNHLDKLRAYHTELKIEKNIEQINILLNNHIFPNNMYQRVQLLLKCMPNKEKLKNKFKERNKLLNSYNLRIRKALYKLENYLNSQ